MVHWRYQNLTFFARGKDIFVPKLDIFVFGTFGRNKSPKTEIFRYKNLRKWRFLEPEKHPIMDYFSYKKHPKMDYF